MRERTARPPAWNHKSICRAISQMLGSETYLEIGVLHGSCFFQVAAKRRFAVDPVFRIRRRTRLLHRLRHPRDRWFEMTSDEFFRREDDRLARHGLDLVFVDGLHTREQVAADVENSLAYLNPGGVIVLHDCSPPHAAAAYPAPSFEAAMAAHVPGWTDEWCGDVWKAVVDLRSTRHDLDVLVVDCDYGVGIVRRRTESAPTPLDLEQDEIDAMGYAELDARRTELLDLQPQDRFPEILEALQTAAPLPVGD